MSTPIVVTACMVQSSESGRPRRPWHLRAGGGAVHSIISGLMHRSKHQAGPFPRSVSCTCLPSALFTNSTESIAAPSWVRNCDRSFHRRRQVSPPVNNLTHGFFDGCYHLLDCHVAVSLQHSLASPFGAAAADIAARPINGRFTAQAYIALPSHSCRGPEFHDGNDGKQGKDCQHGGLRDREGWLSLSRSQRIESRNFHEALHD